MNVRWGERNRSFDHLNPESYVAYWVLSASKMCTVCALFLQIVLYKNCLNFYKKCLNFYKNCLNFYNNCMHFYKNYVHLYNNKMCAMLQKLCAFLSKKCEYYFLNILAHSY